MELLSLSTSSLTSISLISLQPLRSHLPRLPLCYKSSSVSRHGHQHLRLFALNHTAAGAAADHLFVDDDVDDDVILPLEKMDKWLQTKPRGFGEGKEYDTEIEDKLLDEMLQSRQALQTSLSKPKDNEKRAVLDEDGDVRSKNAAQVITGGVRVRLGNLPKKKNVHRDLKAAFEGVPGILAISPAVSGNRKTKDPVCKGFAFVHFNSLEQATRFVQQFSGQSLEFGKIKKPIKCEILQSSPQNSVDEVGGISTETSSAAMDQLDQTDNEVEEMEWPESIENPQVDRSEEPMVSDNNREHRVKAASHPGSKRKFKVVEKKMVTKRKAPKNPKDCIPGSVNKLKFKEKAILTGVFSKYGPKTALTAMEDGVTP